MLTFCPTCANMLLVDHSPHGGGLKLYCQTCPYMYDITKTMRTEVRCETIDIPEEGTTSGNHFIVMASDGVWEFISSKDACTVVQKFLAQTDKPPDATVAVTKLIETAAAKWRQEEGDYRDDITAIVVRLPGLFAHAMPQ